MSDADSLLAQQEWMPSLASLVVARNVWFDTQNKYPVGYVSKANHH